MKTTFLKGAVAGSLFAIVVSGTTLAFAGNGVGGVFNLGEKNTVNAPTTLGGNTNGVMLSVNNKGTGPAASMKSAVGSAAKFTTPPAVPPFAVNSNAKVANLNADSLDGLDSNAFLPVAGTAADSSALGGVAASAYQLHSAIHLVGGPATAVAAGANGTAFADCAASEVAIAGGVRWNPVSFPASGLTIEMVGPSSRADGTVGSWRVDGHNGTASSENLIAYALCINQ